MGLIDIDAFKEKFIKEHELYFNPAEARAVHCIFDALDNTPTAYDVGKVVELLEKESYQEFCDSPKIVELKDAIEIVRKGGVEQMAELKKCPFCGGEAKFTYSVNGSHIHIHCEDTNCIGSTIMNDYETEAEAIEAWNNRVNEFDEDKYEKLIFADMERKKMENEQILGEMRKILLSGENAKEIRAKALSDFIEAVRQKFPNDEIAIWKLEQLAEQLKEE